MTVTNAMRERAKRLHTFYALRNKFKAVEESEKDLDSMTKAQISEFGASIGVTLSMSLTKPVMIETLKATDEFAQSELKRKYYDNLGLHGDPIV